MDSSVWVLAVYGTPARAREIAGALEDADERLQVDPVDGAEEATRRVDEGDVDCVVAGYADGDGLELLDQVRRDQPDLPFVLFSDTEAESIAREAISTGATDYAHHREEPQQYEVLANRIVNAVRAHRRDREASRQRQRLEQILTTVPSCVVQLDVDGNFVFANERAEEVLGLERSEVASRRYDDPEWEIRDLDGSTIPDAELPFRRVLDTESPVRNARHTITRGDGTTRVLSVSGAPLFEDGEVDGVVFSLTDVTDQHRREDRLAQLHEATRDLDGARTPAEVAEITSGAADSVLGFELNGVHLYDESAGGLAPTAVSDAVWDVSDELVTFDEGIAWDAFQAGEVRAYGDITEADEVYDRDTDLRSGLYFPLGEHGVLVVSSQQPNDFDDTDLSLGRVLAANATSALDRVLRERALESVQRQASALMNTSTVAETARLAIETAGEALDADRSWFLERADDDSRLVTTATTDRVADDVPDALERDGAPLASALWAVADGDGPAAVPADEFPTDSPIRSAIAYPVSDGVFVFATDEAEAFDETDRRLCAILVATLEAALERVQREELLRERTQQLADQNEQLDQFASVVAHDLRNPLQVLRGVLETVDADDEYVGRGVRALDRMEDIIDDVLTLARDGTSIDETEPVSLVSVARASSEVVDADEATLVVDEDRRLTADPTRLRQLLENLYRNAVEHSSPTVTVSVGPLADGFYVADDGPGVAPDDRERIFDSGYSDAENGTGFGLAIVARIAKAHGWSVAATESAEGGLRIEFTDVESPE